MKKYLLGFLAVTVAVAGVAFTKPAVKKANDKQPNAIIYFRYIPTTVFTESDFETSTNWVATTNLPNANCSGTVHPCIVSVNDANLSGTTPADFVAYLSTLTGTSTTVADGAITYTSANATQKKP